VKPDSAETRVDSPNSGVKVHAEERVVTVTELAGLIVAVLRLARSAVDIIGRTRRVANGVRWVERREEVAVEGCGREVGVVQPKVVVGVS
jgi:hypothetical protein